MRYLCLIAIVISSLIASPSHPHTQPSSLNPPSFSLITTGNEEVVLPRMQWGLQWIPDGTISAMHENDTTHWWVAADRSTYYFQSRTAAAWKPVINLQGIAQAVFAPDGTGFDADYAAPGTVIQLPTSSDLFMIYHGEDHHCDPSMRQAISVAIGIARSSDGGQTWLRQVNPIITGQESFTACPNRFTGAGTPSAVLSRDQQYLYVYYGDWYNTPHPNERDEIHMARAAILPNGLLGSWQKWYQGAFRDDQPGLGGMSDPVMRRATPEEQTGFAGNPHIHYNARIDRYIAITKSHIGFHYAFSMDGGTCQYF